MSYVVGVTGGIGCGKTIISNLFAELGVPIIDADIFAREVVGKGTQLLTEIVKYFGNEILNDEEELDRAKLRKKIFNDKEQKAWLNDLLHPAIRQHMFAAIQASDAPYVLWVVPLLVENKLAQYCDRILVIDASEDIQLQRTSARDNANHEQIKHIIASQATRAERLAVADDVIENNLVLGISESDLRKQVSQLNRSYLERARNSQ